MAGLEWIDCVWRIQLLKSHERCFSSQISRDSCTRGTVHIKETANSYRGDSELTRAQSRAQPLYLQLVWLKLECCLVETVTKKDWTSDYREHFACWSGCRLHVLNLGFSNVRVFVPQGFSLHWSFPWWVGGQPPHQNFVSSCEHTWVLFQFVGPACRSCTCMNFWFTIWFLAAPF